MSQNTVSTIAWQLITNTFTTCCYCARAKLHVSFLVWNLGICLTKIHQRFISVEMKVHKSWEIKWKLATAVSIMCRMVSINTDIIIWIFISLFYRLDWLSCWTMYTQYIWLKAGVGKGGEGMRGEGRVRLTLHSAHSVYDKLSFIVCISYVSVPIKTTKAQPTLENDITTSPATEDTSSISDMTRSTSLSASRPHIGITTSTDTQKSEVKTMTNVSSSGV